jgi:hypothetical protein
MLPALADLADLEVRLGLAEGTLADADAARAEAALDDASALAREEARRDFLDEDGLPDAPDAVVRVVLAAALRNYTNPNAEISQTAGPFSRTLKASETGVYLTEAEYAICRRYREKETSGLWVLRTTRNDAADNTEWAQDQFGAELFPIGTIDPWLS